MIAYKFLESGALGLFSGFQWPRPNDGLPGAWVETRTTSRECSSGIHVCRIQDLPFWMRDELWAIEIDGDIVEGVDMVVAARGRLLFPLAGWNRAGQRRFAEACRDRAADVVRQAPRERRRHADAFMTHMNGYLRLELTQLGALCAALAVSSTVESDPRETTAIKAAYRGERAWQSQWLIDNLDLDLSDAEAKFAKGSSAL